MYWWQRTPPYKGLLQLNGSKLTASPSSARLNPWLGGMVNWFDILVAFIVGGISAICLLAWWINRKLPKDGFKINW